MGFPYTERLLPNNLMDNPLILILIELVFTAITAVAASAGFWNYFEKKKNKHGNIEALLTGLAHDKIVYLCTKYIDRGFITPDEHENLYKFLYVPYQNLGGNGSVDRLISEVNKLPTFNSESHIKHKLKGDLKDVHPK